ncbi:PQQ-dependent sugar dehydrogenase [Altericroceibacterium endophyticum]|uniref:PQQ-dependent sugar dehydrogenase n=1 Tax=Altericroceibacterium endophyticum TaxID=1808508 RepID=A0A6I4SZL8_9SPHN|nr:PQQ-dependent sugar dehydrogenase [Altericroceibacterium endophyticum]MXO64234.1 PQQ-dependent sugar dehydrogenase [Altericroceibacterium endophyticum]
MSTFNSYAALLSPAALMMASCGSAQAPETSSQSTVAPADRPAPAIEETPFTVSAHGEFDEPWAMAIEPETGRIFITERPGTLKFFNPETGKGGAITGGLPEVDYGGQGGLGDIAFGPDHAQDGTIYLTWVEAGDDDTRGAVLGRGTLVCDEPSSCVIENLDIIWRQVPKLSGRGHYSHRIAFSPDGEYLFLTSGDRQKGDPAQDLSNNLGSVLRLLPDGSAAPGNPFAEKGGVSDQIWSYGHRNLLGLQFDEDGHLWDLEHGPAGGDELNLVEPAKNYGWPLVSDGDHYNGDPIPNPSTRPDLERAAISWNPVIAPGDFIFYRGDMWPEWNGQALIANLKTKSISRVSIDDAMRGTEESRYDFDNRLRDIAEAEDGSLWVIEDGKGGRLLHLTAAKNASSAEQ